LLVELDRRGSGSEIYPKHAIKGIPKFEGFQALWKSSSFLRHLERATMRPAAVAAAATAARPYAPELLSCSSEASRFMAQESVSLRRSRSRSSSREISLLASSIMSESSAAVSLSHWLLCSSTCSSPSDTVWFNISVKFMMMLPASSWVLLVMLLTR